MAKPRSEESVTPSGEKPSATPEGYLQGRSSDMMVVQFIMELQHDFGRVREKLDAVAVKVDKVGDKVDTLHDKYLFLKGAAWVIGLAIPLVGFLLWWSIGERIEAVLRPPASISTSQPASPSAPSGRP